MYKVSMLLIENRPDRSEPDQHKHKPERKMNERCDKRSVNSHATVFKWPCFTNAPGLVVVVYELMLFRY